MHNAINDAKFLKCVCSAQSYDGLLVQVQTVCYTFRRHSNGIFRFSGFTNLARPLLVSFQLMLCLFKIEYLFRSNLYAQTFVLHEQLNITDETKSFLKDTIFSLVTTRLYTMTTEITIPPQIKQYLEKKNSFNNSQSGFWHV